MTGRDRERIFRQVLTDSAGIILKIVRSFGVGAEDQHDLFQEIALQMWTSIPSFRGDAKVTTWVYRVALNTALNWQRGERKHRSRHDPVFEMSRAADCLAAQPSTTENAELLAWLHQQVRLLNPVVAPNLERLPCDAVSGQVAYANAVGRPVYRSDRCPDRRERPMRPAIRVRAVLRIRLALFLA